MVRSIKYKEVSKEYQKLASPNTELSTNTRFSAGLEQSIGEYYYLKLDELIPFANQAREIFNEDEIKELSDSIALYGIRQPLTIIPSSHKNGKYEIVSGERRYKAAILAGLDKVPCIVLSNDYPPDAIALVENYHRSELHPLELMNSLNTLIEQKVFSSQREISAKTGISHTIISEILSLRNLPSDTKEILLNKGLKSRSLLRQLLKSKEKDHVNIISKFENSKDTAAIRNKKVFDSKIKVLNIVRQNDIFLIESDKTNELDIIQKDEIRRLLEKLIDKL